MLLATPGQSNEGGTALKADSSSLKAGKGPLLDTREQTQNPESNGYEKHNTDIADGNSVNDASVADGAGCKAPSLKKKKKEEKEKEEEQKNF